MGVSRKRIGAMWSPKRFMPLMVLKAPLKRESSQMTWLKIAVSNSEPRKL